MTAHGTFHWNELNTWQPDKAKAFFGEVIGWSFDAMPMPEGTYWIAKAGDVPVGGIFTLTSPTFDGVPDHWLPYLAVDEIDARLEHAKRAGATVLRPPFEVPGVGRIAIVKDPTGAVAGWITPAPR